MAETDREGEGGEASADSPAKAAKRSKREATMDKRPDREGGQCKPDREARLAEALRENLRRRKLRSQKPEARNQKD